ncbi:TPA: ribbon-helix-helix domain-containing protein [Bacillus nitratireducens]|uniref:ribbon-helix-helix domain-containing protein n=1 Tax=Bacillus cereus group TaxID=86661 RepID=UPI001D0EAE74|nr:MULTISPECIES: ribbon-helix-helix domain-containing protein [Bacillus cereus group]MBQ6448901.1 ribbon-helix-helix domain-containing protein [Bacillus sp. (in: firmicutes)]MBR3121376.1 ribbon-helix-helix domain-containing protein [Oceanobacillus sp.]MCC2370028.1 ribbon-helix-helix domain-containing protein [Bacillus cereus]MCC2450754.1 ribbon-helix-helix domain-containing protein [Bacillus cereus]MCC2491708.1 ribbon-helix-helix domain-containing protein [Bacillus cereus]
MSENRGLKTRKALSNAVRMDLYEQLKNLSDETKIPMSKLLDEAIEDLIVKRKPTNK